MPPAANGAVRATPPSRRYLLGLAAGIVAAWVVGSVGIQAHRLPFMAPDHALWRVFANVVLLPFGAVGALLVGVPIHHGLAATGRLGWRAYALAGGAGGLVLSAAVFGLIWLMDDPAAEYEAGLLAQWCASGTLAGLAGAMAFWTIFRPDLAARAQA